MTDSKENLNNIIEWHKIALNNADLMIMKLTAENDRLKTLVDQRTGEGLFICDELKKAKELLKELEWGKEDDDGYTYCQICGEYKEHSPDCKLSQFISKE